MSFAFILIGSLFIGIAGAGILSSKSRTLKPKYLRTKTSKYYTLGQLAIIKIKSWWKNYGKEKPAGLHFEDKGDKNEKLVD